MGASSVLFPTVIDLMSMQEIPFTGLGSGLVQEKVNEFNSDISKSPNFRESE